MSFFSLPPIFLVHPTLKRHSSHFFSPLPLLVRPLAFLPWLWRLALSFEKGLNTCFHALLLVAEALVASHRCQISHPQLSLQGGQFPSRPQKADRITVPEH